jgi:hypothetical protein
MQFRSLPFYVGVASVLALAASAAERPWAPPIAKGPIRLYAERLFWRPALPGLPEGCRIASLEGNPAEPDMFTMRVTLPAEARLAPHWHAQGYRVTIISGSVFVGGGDAIVESYAEELPVGAFWASPAGFHHYFFTKQQAVVQITAMGPWDITYVDQKDDPRTPTAGAVK